jgi:energy-converting hydrogenase Eha subunit G
MSPLKYLGTLALGASVPFWWTALTSALGYLAYQYFGARSVAWVSYVPSTIAGVIGGSLLILLAARRASLAAALYVAAAVVAFLVIGATNGIGADYYQALIASPGTWFFLAASVAVPMLFVARSNKSLERTREG